jgi:hypothetical protein
MSSIIYLTEDGLKRLQNELHQLKSVERPSISAQIAEARDKGDLSENAEYDAAKEAQGLLELKISKMEDMVANARIIDESKLDASKVLILSKVKIKNTLNNGSYEINQEELKEYGVFSIDDELVIGNVKLYDQKLSNLISSIFSFCLPLRIPTIILFIARRSSVLIAV